MARIWFIMAALFFILVPQAQATKPREPLKVVASFSILADLVRQVGGVRVQVTALVEPGVDAHTYQPSAQDVKQLSHTDLIFINGLGFEGWVERLIKASGTRSTTIILGQSITPILSKNGRPDPHVWHDIMRVQRYVEAIAQALSKYDPQGRAFYQKQAAAYQQKLALLHQNFKNRFASLAPKQRVIMTAHDAFGYLAQAQGLTIIPLKGLSTQDEPSARQLAQLVDQIRAGQVQALFYENSTSPRLLKSLAMQTSIRVGGTLYSDALSKADGPAATYLAFMQYNLETIARALVVPAPHP